MKRIVTFLLAVIFLFSSASYLMPVSAYADGRNGDAAEAAVLKNASTKSELKWSVKKGVLTISGKGDMPDWPVELTEVDGEYFYDYVKDMPPWYGGNYEVNRVVIEKGITSVGAGAFFRCYDLESVSIPDSVTRIGARAFYEIFLETVVIPDSVTEIGEYAFSECIQLSKVKLPRNAVIGANAFSWCESLESVKIPDGVTTVGEYAFAECYNLEKVYMSDSVKKIGKGAFDNCNSLKKVYYSGTKNQWKKIKIGKDNKSLTGAKIIYNAK